MRRLIAYIENMPRRVFWRWAISICLGIAALLVALTIRGCSNG